MKISHLFHHISCGNVLTGISYIARITEMAKLAEIYCKVHEISKKIKPLLWLTVYNFTSPEEDPGSIAEEAEWAPRAGLEGCGRSRSPYGPALNESLRGLRYPDPQNREPQLGSSLSDVFLGSDSAMFQSQRFSWDHDETWRQLPAPERWMEINSQFISYKLQKLLMAIPFRYLKETIYI